MGYISSTNSELAVLPFGASKPAEPLAHQCYCFYTLASPIACKIQVTARSHVLFPLTTDLLSPSRKRWWVCWVFS